MPEKHSPSAARSHTRVLTREDFHYRLPDSLIARMPAPERDASRLLVLTEQGVVHRQFSELPTLLAPGDLLVVNDTQVIKARLLARKDSGGRAEVLVERLLSDTEALCQVRVSKPLRPRRELITEGGNLIVLGREGEFYRLRFPEAVLGFLSRFGSVPLPPYIGRTPDAGDEQRYQTLWGRRPGAVAAPTAGLHFSEAVLGALARRGVKRVAVTLHVGAGTFQPVRTNDLDAHRMHSERYEVPEETASAIRNTKARGGRIVAVGTTVVRTLEAVAGQSGEVRAGSGETDLFIRPGFDFRVVDLLITNFHLPESTLLMLVAAFGGYEPVMQAYRCAVRERYRFFSYGDAMLISRHEQR